MKSIVTAGLLLFALGARAYTCTAFVEVRPGVVKSKSMKALTAYTRTASLKGYRFSANEILGDHLVFEIFRRSGRVQDVRPMPTQDGQNAQTNVVMDGRPVGIVCQDAQG